jgi:hypothetical protein
LLYYALKLAVWLNKIPHFGQGLESIPNNTLHQSLLTKTTDYETKPTQGEDAATDAPHAGAATSGIFAENQLHG